MPAPSDERLSTAILELDGVRGGSLISRRRYLLSGWPGSGSDFERTLREFQIAREGVTVGGPLTTFHGVRRDTPEIVEEIAQPANQPTGV